MMPRALVGHWIDLLWELQSQTLDSMAIDSGKSDCMAAFMADVMRKMGIENKVSGIVGDTVRVNSKMVRLVNETVQSDTVIERLMCMCHTIQLVLHDAFNNDPIVKKFLKRIRRHVAFLRTASIARLLSSMGAQDVIGDVETRWSSVAIMMARLLVLEEV